MGSRYPMIFSREDETYVKYLLQRCGINNDRLACDDRNGKEDDLKSCGGTRAPCAYHEDAADASPYSQINRIPFSQWPPIP